MDGQQLRREAEFAFFQARGAENFRNMAVIEDRISREILGNFTKTGFERRLAPGPTHARLAVANDPGFTDHYARIQQRLDGQIRRGRIAARVRNQPSSGNPRPVELRQSVGRLGKQLRLMVRLAIPVLIIFDGAQPEGATEVDHFDSGFEQRQGQLQRHVGGSGQKYHCQAFGVHRLGSELQAARPGLPQRPRGVLGIAMIEEDRFYPRMLFEDAGQLRAAVSAEAQDAYGNGHD